MPSSIGTVEVKVTPRPLDPDTACARTACPTCGQPAFVWVWMPLASRPDTDTQPEGVHIVLRGLVTDLMHEADTDCRGVA